MMHELRLNGYSETTQDYSENGKSAHGETLICLHTYQTELCTPGSDLNIFTNDSKTNKQKGAG